MNKNKYDTVPNIRNSAKNRKKLEKIFSIGASTSTNAIENNSIFNTSNSKKQNTNNTQENNLYLSKLKADKYNDMSLSTSRYSPSNPESGIFSLSDYDHK